MGSEGAVRGQLPRGQCFVETPLASRSLSQRFGQTLKPNYPSRSGSHEQLFPLGWEGGIGVLRYCSFGHFSRYFLVIKS